MNIPQLSPDFPAGQEYGVYSNCFHGGDCYPEHRHRFYEFFLVTEGALTHRKNGLTDTMARRSLCLNYPDDQHELSNSREHEHVTIVNCTFSKPLLGAVEKLVTSAGLQRPPSGWSRTLKNIPPTIWQGLENKTHRLLFQHGQMSPAGRNALFQSLLLDVLLLLAEPEKGMTSAPPEWLVRLREKMQQEENFIVGLDRMLQLARRSQEHLTRTMRRFYGETPTEFINRLRTAKAARMLLQSQLNLLAIMEECGFRNYAWFLRCFHRNFSMSPQQYLTLNRRPLYPLNRIGRHRILTDKG